MNKTKTFTQYTGDLFSIRVVIGIKGNIRGKSDLAFLGEHKKKYNKQWNKDNEEYRKERDRQYYKDNQEHLEEYRKQWNEDNKEYKSEYQKQYYKTSAGKLTIKRSNAKRKNFGFIPLNDWFKNCEGHHLNYDDVIFIPKELHRSVYHSVTQNINMNEINNAVFEWYGENQ